MADAFTIKLTQAQREQISRDMDEMVEMLSEDEIEHLAAKLNQHIDIPFMPSGKEHTILAKLVRKVDRYLYTILPNELYSLVKTGKRGISDEQAQQLAEIITTRANRRFDIPYLPESIEQRIFLYLAEQIISAMRKQVSILEL